MKITNEQSLYIASYLRKGAFFKNHRDICIPLAPEAEIGIIKHGKNYNIYIKYAGKRLYNGENRFTDQITEEDLATLIVEAISNCAALPDLDLELNMANSAQQTTTQQSISEEDSYKELVQKIEEEMADDDNYDLEKDEDIKEENNSEIPYIPDKLDTPEYTQSMVGEVVGMAEDEEIYADITPDTPTIEPVDTVAALSISKAHTKKIAETSYIYRLGTNEEMKQRMHMVVERLVDDDKELATELYIRGIVSLLALYNNDMAKMSADTGIDIRDITLAYYEQQIIQK